MHVFCTWQRSLAFSSWQLCTHDTRTSSQSQMEMGVARTWKPFVLRVIKNVSAHTTLGGTITCMIWQVKHDLREMVWQRQSRNQIYLHESRVYQPVYSLSPFIFSYFSQKIIISDQFDLSYLLQGTTVIVGAGYTLLLWRAGLSSFFLIKSKDQQANP
jgi:hypothetical protein